MAEGTPRYTRDARGQLVVVYPDGTVIPVLGVDHGTVDPGTSRPLAVEPQGAAAADGYGSAAPRTYTPRPPRDSRGSDGSDGYDRAEPPAYADGSRHPAFGGDPRLPGGAAAARNAGESRDFYLPSGQGNAPTPNRPREDSGGGGGGASDLYYRMRSKLTGGGSSGSSYGSSSYGYQKPKEPREPNMRGPYAKGLDPTQAANLGMRPTAMIPRALPGLDSASPIYGELADLPAYQLAMLSKRGYSGSPKAVANSLGRFYNAAGTTGDLPEFNEVFRNLTNPKKGGGIDEMFSGVKNPASVRKATGYEYEYGREPLDAATAANTAEGLFDAAFSLLPTQTAAAYSSLASGLLDKAALKAMKKPAGKRSVTKYVGRRLFR